MPSMHDTDVLSKTSFFIHNTWPNFEKSEHKIHNLFYTTFFYKDALDCLTFLPQKLDKKSKRQVL